MAVGGKHFDKQQPIGSLERVGQVAKRSTSRLLAHGPAGGSSPRRIDLWLHQGERPHGDANLWLVVANCPEDDVQTLTRATPPRWEFSTMPRALRVR
jgi:hypothetical protein